MSVRVYLYLISLMRRVSVFGFNAGNAMRLDRLDRLVSSRFFSMESRGRARVEKEILESENKKIQALKKKVKRPRVKVGTTQKIFSWAKKKNPRTKIDDWRSKKYYSKSKQWN